MAAGVDLTAWMFAGNRSKGTGSFSSDLRLYHKTDIIPQLLLLSRDQAKILSGVIFREEGAAIQWTNWTLPNRKPILLSHFYEDSSFLFQDIPQKGNEANFTFGAEI